MVVGLFDLGLPPSARPLVYIHWLVTNIPKNSVELGTEVFDYIKPFALKLDVDNNIVKDAEQSNQPNPADGVPPAQQDRHGGEPGGLHA